MEKHAGALSAKKLYALVTQHIASRVVAFACEHRFDEILQEKPMTIANFSTVLGFDVQATSRLLKILDYYGIVELVGVDKVRQGLCAKALATIRGPHLLNGFLTMNQLDTSLKKNSECYSVAFGETFSAHIQKNAELTDSLQGWSQSTVDWWLFSSIQDAYDFSKFTSFCEIGGDGRFLAKLLRTYKQAKGLLVNANIVPDSVKKLFSDLTLNNRVHYVIGERFIDAPQEVDVYIFCRTLLNRSDDNIIETLSCSESSRKNSPVLIIDFYLPPENNPDYLLSLLADINILTCLGGKLRTKEEWLGIMRSCGFVHYQFYELGQSADSPTVLPMFLIEAFF